LGAGSRANFAGRPAASGYGRSGNHGYGNSGRDYAWRYGRYAGYAAVYAAGSSSSNSSYSDDCYYARYGVGRRVMICDDN